jgi:hypothetical protein
MKSAQRPNRRSCDRLPVSPPRGRSVTSAFLCRRVLESSRASATSCNGLIPPRRRVIVDCGLAHRLPGPRNPGHDGRAIPANGFSKLVKPKKFGWHPRSPHSHPMYAGCSGLTSLGDAHTGTPLLPRTAEYERAAVVLHPQPVIATRRQLSPECPAAVAELNHGVQLMPWGVGRSGTSLRTLASLTHAANLRPSVHCRPRIRRLVSRCVIAFPQAVPPPGSRLSSAVSAFSICRLAAAHFRCI